MMAERLSGHYSPTGPEAGKGTEAPKDPWRGQRPLPAGARVNFLFLAPLPLALRAFLLEPGALALTLVALAVLLLAAWLTREGVKAQAEYDARRTARRPAIPRKLLGSALTGAGIFLAAWADGGTLNAAILAVLGLGLHLFAFGPDPLRDKGMEGIDTFQQERVARAVDEAERHLKAMREAIARAGDRALERRIERFEATAREMFRTIEEDPRDLAAARRYLGIYLLGARDATIRFADLFARTGDARARADYEALLDDLEENFAARTEALLANDRAGLDVEIEVLRERLEREGVRMRG
jgi:hypothetical protein